MRCTFDLSGHVALNYFPKSHIWNIGLSTGDCRHAVFFPSANIYWMLTLSLKLCWVPDMEGRKVNVRWVLGEFSDPVGGIDLGPPELDFGTSLSHSFCPLDSCRDFSTDSFQVCYSSFPMTSHQHFSSFKTKLQTPSSCISVSLKSPLSPSPGHSLTLLLDPVIQLLGNPCWLFPACSPCLLSLLSIPRTPAAADANYYFSPEK